MARSAEEARRGASLRGRQRERYVERMFDRIAAPYDRLNRIMSLGRDRAWRRRAVELTSVGPGDRACDLGTGTGDLAFLLAERVGPGGSVVGVDLSRGMLDGAARKQEALGLDVIEFRQANAEATGLPAGEMAAVTMGWSLRNVGDRPAVYREILRLLAPGGRLVIAEMSRPRNPLARVGFWVFRHTALPVLARLCRADAEAYRYLAVSTDGFPDAPALEAELRAAGFEHVAHHPLMLGAVALHVARRPSL